jgi:hypothetical protein
MLDSFLYRDRAVTTPPAKSRRLLGKWEAVISFPVRITNRLARIINGIILAFTALIIKDISGWPRPDWALLPE